MGGILHGSCSDVKATSHFVKVRYNFESSAGSLPFRHMTSALCWLAWSESASNWPLRSSTARKATWGFRAASGRLGCPRSATKARHCCSSARSGSCAACSCACSAATFSRRRQRASAACSCSVRMPALLHEQCGCQRHHAWTLGGDIGQGKGWSASKVRATRNISAIAHVRAAFLPASY